MDKMGQIKQIMGQKRCETCRFYKKEHGTGNWVCINPEAEAFGLSIEADSTCFDYEAKGGNTITR